MDVYNFQERFCCHEILNEEERRLFYELRYQEYVIDHDLEQPNSDHLEKDSFDEFSHHFGCFEKEKEQLVAVARLIDARRTALVLENYTQKPISRNSLEVSRFIVRKEKIKREDRCYVRAELFYNLQKFAEQKNYDYMYAFIFVRYFQALKRTGGGFFEIMGNEVSFKNNLYLPVGAKVSVVGEYLLTNKIWQSYFFKNKTDPC